MTVEFNSFHCPTQEDMYGLDVGEDAMILRTRLNLPYQWAGMLLATGKTHEIKMAPKYVQADSVTFIVSPDCSNITALVEELSEGHPSQMTAQSVDKECIHKIMDSIEGNLENITPQFLVDIGFSSNSIFVG